MSDLEIDFFVVGCGRSGTSLLHSMLQRHPRVCIPPASHFIPPLLRMDQLPLRSGTRVSLARRFLSRNPRFRSFGCDLPDAASIPELLTSIYRSYAQANEATVVGDKSPDYVTAIPLLHAAAPRAKFVHLVRDPRAVAASLIRLPDWGPNDPSAAALYWSKRVRPGREAGAALSSCTYLELSYEELVTEPHQVLERLCIFLNIAFDSSMLSYFQEGHVLQSRHLGDGHHRRLSEPPSLKETWRDDLTDEAVAVIEALCRSDMAELGYEPEASLRLSASLLRTTASARLSEFERRARLLPTYAKSYVR